MPSGVESWSPRSGACLWCQPIPEGSSPAASADRAPLGAVGAHYLKHGLTLRSTLHLNAIPLLPCMARLLRGMDGRYSRMRWRGGRSESSPLLGAGILLVVVVLAVGIGLAVADVAGQVATDGAQEQGSQQSGPLLSTMPDAAPASVDRSSDESGSGGGSSSSRLPTTQHGAQSTDAGSINDASQESDPGQETAETRLGHDSSTYEPCSPPAADPGSPPEGPAHPESDDICDARGQRTDVQDPVGKQPAPPPDSNPDEGP